MKTVLITGCSSGYGLETARQFHARGWNVIATMRRPREGILPRSDRLRMMSLDVRDSASIAAAVAASGPIDVLVNNAAATQRKPFLESGPADWAPQVDVTVTGTLRITHAVARGMAARRAGAIVNLMGDSGRVGESGLLVTATTRAATVGLTKSLARELARHGIRANCVSIALVQTDNLEAHAGGAEDERMKKILAQYPLRRLGRPADVTAMILLLASPLSSWTTGQVISVNGGYAMP